MRCVIQPLYLIKQHKLITSSAAMENVLFCACKHTRVMCIVTLHRCLFQEKTREQVVFLETARRYLRSALSRRVTECSYYVVTCDVERC